MKKRITKKILKRENAIKYSVRTSNLRFREGILYLEALYFTMPLPVELPQKRKITTS